MSLRKAFIRNLKYYRKKAGLTQEKLAEALGMSTSYIGDMEARSRFPSAETIEKIAAVLCVRPAALFEEQGCPESINEFYREQYALSLKEALFAKIKDDIDEIFTKGNL